MRNLRSLLLLVLALLLGLAAAAYATRWIAQRGTHGLDARRDCRGRHRDGHPDRTADAHDGGLAQRLTASGHLQ